MWLGKLGDNDKHYGPLTISFRGKKEKKNPFFMYCYLESVTEESGIEESTLEESYCNTLTFHLSMVGSVRLKLPFKIIKPKFTKVYPKSWDENTIKRLGRNYYYDVAERRYGFNMTSSGYQITLGGSMFGIRKTIVKDWPWGIEHHSTTSYHANTNEPYRKDNSKFSVERDNVTNANFLIRDFDGEVLVVSAYKRRMDFYRGKGLFKWFSYLLPFKHFWHTELYFSKETGGRKGSWKGGTIGSSILSDETEDIADSVKRYCDKHGMVELGFIGYTVGPIKKDDIVPTVKAILPIYVNFLNPKTEEV